MIWYLEYSGFLVNSSINIIVRTDRFFTGLPLTWASILFCYFVLQLAIDVLIPPRWGRSRFTAVICETQFILVLLLINYCILFHMNNCKPTFAPTCIHLFMRELHHFICESLNGDKLTFCTQQVVNKCLLD